MLHTWAGRGFRIRGWSRLRHMVIPLGVAVWILLANVASASAGSSGGAPGAPAPAPAPPAPVRAGALAQRGMWIWYVSHSDGGDLASILTTARAYGLGTLMIKSGDGALYWPQFNSQLVSTLHADGLRVCAWQYVYGNEPLTEAEVGAEAVRAGADCLLIDAESEYQGKYVQAEEYMRRLRRLIGARFPVGLAGFPYVDYHPSFPYSVFLGPGGAQYNVPQMYWPDIGTSVDGVYQHTYEFNTLYGRPIEPIGEVAGNPPPGQILRFRQESRAYGAVNVSWWDWQESSARDWRAVGQAVGDLQDFAPDFSMPTLSIKSVGGIWAGDLVVWAQEHLYRAGYPMLINGDFGSDTEAAVESFQTAHGLPATGLVDPTTWQALLRYAPVSVTWVHERGQTTATASRAGSVVLTPPASARLPARRYEIPRDLGASIP